jgi:hypothetical protein
MADNTVLNPGTGGDSVRDIDRLGAGVKTQVVQLDFGGGSGNAEQLASSTNPLPVAISATPFQPSAGNTSSVQLASGQIFAGAIQANQNQPIISIDMYSDQPMLVWVQQYIDAAGQQPIPTIYPNGYQTPTQPNSGMSFAFGGNGNYYQVFCQNVGQQVTTRFVIDSGSGTLAPITPLGNAPSAINEIGGVAVKGGVIPITLTNPGDIAAANPVQQVQIVNQWGDLAQEVPVVGRVVADVNAVNGVPLAGNAMPVALQAPVAVSNFPASSAVTMADGALAALGSTNDAPAYSISQSSMIAQLKGLNDRMQQQNLVQLETLSVLNAILGQLQANGAQLGAAPVSPNFATNLQ